jgi:hypothetical protein
MDDSLMFITLQAESNMKVNHAVELVPKIKNRVVDGSMNPKRHPGIMNIKPVRLPERLEKAMHILLESKDSSILFLCDFANIYTKLQNIH